MSFETSDRAFKIFAEAYGRAWSATPPLLDPNGQDRLSRPGDIERAPAAPSTIAEAASGKRRRRPTRPL